MRPAKLKLEGNAVAIEEATMGPVEDEEQLFILLVKDTDTEMVLAGYEFR